jgi:hypothetical protein
MDKKELRKLQSSFEKEEKTFIPKLKKNLINDLARRKKRNKK